MNNYWERVKFGSIFMLLTGVGFFFIGAVPIVALFGGFPENTKNIGDTLGSIGITFIVGILLYVALIVYIFI